MSKALLKSEALFEQPRLNIDRENGIIKNAVIIQEGICKNKDYVSTDFLNDLVDMAQAQKQGVKSRFGHPNMCGTSFGSYIGRFKNYQVINEENKYKVIADLHLDPITKKSQVEGRGISMYEYIMDMAENNSDMFGTSIHFTAKKEPYTDENGLRVKDADGYEINKPTLKSYIASDVVDTPAATDSFFKNTDDLGIITTQFLDTNPQIFEHLKNDPSIVVNFLSKYSKSITKKDNKMSIIKSLKKAIGMTKDIDITLADGNIVKVITDAEKPAVGDTVTDAEGSPVADGTHIDKDGNEIVTVDGAITEIKPKEEPTEPEAPEEMSEGVKSYFDEQFKKMNATINNKFKDQEEGLEFLAKEIGSVKKSHETLAKSVKTNYKAPKDGERKSIKDGGEQTLAEKVKEQREARKDKK